VICFGITDNYMEIITLFAHYATIKLGSYIIFGYDMIFIILWLNYVLYAILNYVICFYKIRSYYGY